MAYTGFDFYANSYHGDVLSSENADKWLERASDFIDAITFRRTESAFPENEADAVKVRKAVCAIAEAQYLIDTQAKATQANVDAQGILRTAVASISSGRESISYMQNANGSAYAKAATDQAEARRLLSDIAALYLADVPDSTGVNLLYAGVE